VDFTTTEGADSLSANKSQNAKRYKSWLHKWLVENASTYTYEPLASEAFHWSHKMPDRRPRSRRTRTPAPSEGTDLNASRSPTYLDE
jgi:hypothetical protein